MDEVENNMAIDGTYGVTVNTPMGKQKGDFVLFQDGNMLTGTVTIMKNVIEIQDGKVDGDNFEGAFEAKTPMGRMKMSMKGNVDGDIISGTISMKLGEMPFEGVKMS